MSGLGAVIAGLVTDGPRSGRAGLLAPVRPDARTGAPAAARRGRVLLQLRPLIGGLETAV